MKLSYTAKLIIARMDKRGLGFDEISSEKGRLLFNETGACFPLEFKTWKEVVLWLRETS